MSLEQTQRRRQAVSTIHDIVGAMRAIAAGRIQGAQRALAAARRYQDVVIRTLGSLAMESNTRWLPSIQNKCPVLLVLTSEQPLCGAFNQNILTLAQQRWHELRQQGPVSLVVVGQRGVRQLTARGMVPDVSLSAVTSLPGLRDLVKHLAQIIDQRYARQEAGDLYVIYNCYKSVSEQLPTEERILPLDLNQLHLATTPPASGYYRYLPIPVLLAGLVSEYAFISLYRMAADSFAGEQASRLVAMDGATRNTERMLQTLLHLERREHQGEVTRQVMELLGTRFTIS